MQEVVTVRSIYGTASYKHFLDSFACKFLIIYKNICLFLARGGLYIPTKQWYGQSMVNGIGFSDGVGRGVLTIACLYEV